MDQFFSNLINFFERIILTRFPFKISLITCYFIVTNPTPSPLFVYHVRVTGKYSLPDYLDQMKFF